MSDFHPTACQIFDECDVQQRGWLAAEDLGRACPQLSCQEIQFIFVQLDVNKDGKISRQEFEEGFGTVLAKGEQSGFRDLRRRASVVSVSSPNKPDITFNLETDHGVVLEELPCQEELLSLYEQLQQSGVPAMLTQFERVIGGFCKEIKEYREQNERLQQIYQAEKDRYNRQITEVESEVDLQVAQAEERARRKEREKMEREKEEMRQRLESEVNDLQGNIKRLQKMESVLAESSEKAQKINEMKSRHQELMGENRVLKSDLIQRQTEMALIKARLAQMRHEYDDKCTDLMSEKETLIAYIQEQDNLTRQLQLLYDANKKLHDTNDSLRSALETRRAFCKQYNLRTPSPISPSSSVSHSRQSSTASARMTSPGSAGSPKRSRLNLRLANRPNTDSIDETDDDSGLARCSDATNGSLAGSDLLRTPRQRPEDESDVSSSEKEGDVTSETDIPNSDRFHSSRLRSDDRYSVTSGGTLTSGSRSRRLRREPDLDKSRKPLQEQSSDPTGPPERTFRVVLAGDASVGKSSLIMRLVKGQFVPNLQSTLGVDFHVKTLNVDGRNVAIQLWDTAGQERFRSLCKSYFRRADGALLVYDCCSEASFLNVRSWIESIQETVPKKIPILLCGNKVDMRISANAEGKRTVQTEDGEKIGKLFNGIFIETSAKEGTNVKQAALQLARELLASEDVEVRSTGIIPIASSSSSTSRSCCSRS